MDLLLVVDTSGSLKSKFNKTIEVVKRVLNAVAISQKATRVAMVGFRYIFLSIDLYNIVTTGRHSTFTVDSADST